MSHIVNMVRNSVEPGGRDHFSCSADAWSLLLDIGQAFGWKPLGTSYVPGDIALMPDNPTRHDYQPGDQQDGKLVNAADAVDWANALSAARDSPYLATMIGDRPQIATLRDTATADELRSVNAPFVTTMNEFIAYAFGGEFTFYRSP